MRTISYLYPLSSDETDRLRVRATTHRGEIVEFVVQYEIRREREWCPVVRFDTAHGFAHRDLLHPDGRIDKQPLPWADYQLALTFATQELKANWHRYRQAYEEEDRHGR